VQLILNAKKVQFSCHHVSCLQDSIHRGSTMSAQHMFINLKLRKVTFI